MRKKTIVLAGVMLLALTSMVYAEVDFLNEELNVVSPEDITEEKIEVNEKSPLAVQERTVNCGECNGLVATHEVGRGTSTMVDSTPCSEHSNCSLQIYEQRVYYEEICGGTCGYINSFYTIEYTEKHAR